MKITSALLTNASGSLGGMTAAQNRGGLYLRSRAQPVQRNSPRQQAAKAALTTVSQFWSASLSIADQAAWDTYGKNVTVVNSLGQAKNLTGLQAFQMGNAARTQIPSPIVQPGPTTFSLATFTLPTGIAVAAPGTLTFTPTATDDWFTTANGYLLVSISRPQNYGLQFFKSPFQLIGAVAKTGSAGPDKLANPTGAPLATPASTGGTLAAGTWNGVVTYADAIGETLPSAGYAGVTTGTTSSIAWASGETPPTGTVSVNLYTVLGSGTYRLTSTIPVATWQSTGYLQTAAPSNTAPIPPTANTTGSLIIWDGTSAITMQIPFTYGSNNRAFIRFKAINADGRASIENIATVLTPALAGLSAASLAKVQAEAARLIREAQHEKHAAKRRR